MRKRGINSVLALIAAAMLLFGTAGTCEEDQQPEQEGPAVPESTTEQGAGDPAALGEPADPGGGGMGGPAEGADEPDPLGGGGPGGGEPAEPIEPPQGADPLGGGGEQEPGAQ